MVAVVRWGFDMAFQHQTILITGGLGGIGGEVTRHLLAKGARVVVTDFGRTPDSLPEGTEFIPLNVASEQDWEQVIEGVVAKHGALNGLVNIAGVFTPGIPFEDMTLAQWRHHMDINLDGSFMGCRFAIKAMAKTGGGSIVNFSSGLAHIMLSDGGAYCGQGRRQVRGAGQRGAAWRDRHADALGQSARRPGSAGPPRHAGQAASDRPHRPDHRRGPGGGFPARSGKQLRHRGASRR